MPLEWNDSTIVTFLNAYEKHECLWNPYHKDFYDYSEKRKAVQFVIEELNVQQFTFNDCLQQIKLIREKNVEFVKLIVELYDLQRRCQAIKQLQLQCPCASDVPWFFLVKRMLIKIIQDEDQYKSSKFDHTLCHMSTNKNTEQNQMTHTVAKHQNNVVKQNIKCVRITKSASSCVSSNHPQPNNESCPSGCNRQLTEKFEVHKPNLTRYENKARANVLCSIYRSSRVKANTITAIKAKRRRSQVHSRFVLCPASPEYDHTKVKFVKNLLTCDNTTCHQKLHATTIIACTNVNKSSNTQDNVESNKSVKNLHTCNNTTCHQKLHVITDCSNMNKSSNTQNKVELNKDQIEECNGAFINVSTEQQTEEIPTIAGEIQTDHVEKLSHSTSFYLDVRDAEVSPMEAQQSASKNIQAVQETKQESVCVQTQVSSTKKTQCPRVFCINRAISSDNILFCVNQTTSLGDLKSYAEGKEFGMNTVECSAEGVQCSEPLSICVSTELCYCSETTNVVRCKNKETQCVSKISSQKTGNDIKNINCCTGTEVSDIPCVREVETSNVMGTMTQKYLNALKCSLKIDKKMESDTCGICRSTCTEDIEIHVRNVTTQSEKCAVVFKLNKCTCVSQESINVLGINVSEIGTHIDHPSLILITRRVQTSCKNFANVCSGKNDHDKGICAHLETKDAKTNTILTMVTMHDKKCQNTSQLLNSYVRENSTQRIQKITIGTQKREPILVHVIKYKYQENVSKPSKQIGGSHCENQLNNDRQNNVIKSCSLVSVETQNSLNYCNMSAACCKTMCKQTKCRRSYLEESMSDICDNTCKHKFSNWAKLSRLNYECSPKCAEEQVCANAQKSRED